jgi:segregation and condensation protein A
VEALTYRLETFEGPLDLLLSLIQKNKVEISDIPIALICDQYMAYITEAERLDMDLASEFIVMASELMLIKSKMLLPKAEPEEEDPRAELADALRKYQQAKAAAALLGKAYPTFSGRMVKDTDEISVDKTFVQDQDVTALCAAVRRIVAYNNAREKAANTAFKPMISKPVVPVELKIVGILKRMDNNGGKSTLKDILSDSVSLPDMIAIFIGVLELIKVKKILIDESDEISDQPDGNLHGENTRFIINTNEEDILESSGDNYN